MQYFQSWEAFGKFLTPLMEGTAVSLELFAFTVLFSVPLGFVICFGRISRVAPLRWLSGGYVLLFRGTPLMLQLLFFHFGLAFLNINPGRMEVAIITFSLNYAAYFAEIFRGGILSIPKGQHEAADMLGFTRRQSFAKIILPQVIKNVMPPVGNELITLVKDTALVTIIALSDLLREAQIMVNRDNNLLPFVGAGVFYLILTSLFTVVFARIEKNLSYYKV